MTAEFAVLMPVMVTLLAAVLAAAAAALGYVQCLDASRAAARLAARHEQLDVVVGSARRLAPGGAQVSVIQAGDEVRVRVTADVALPLPWRPRFGITQESSARLEEEP